jgi:mRNA interferase MazF
VIPQAPARGQVWLIDLNFTRGHEQAGTRPGLIVSVDPFNQSPLGLAVVVPITSKTKDSPLHVRIEPPECGLEHTSYAKCEDVRSVSQERLTRPLGRATPTVIRQVEDRLRLILGL